MKSLWNLFHHQKDGNQWFFFELQLALQALFAFALAIIATQLDMHIFLIGQLMLSYSIIAYNAANIRLSFKHTPKAYLANRQAKFRYFMLLMFIKHEIFPSLIFYHIFLILLFFISGEAGNYAYSSLFISISIFSILNFFYYTHQIIFRIILISSALTYYIVLPLVHPIFQDLILLLSSIILIKTNIKNFKSFSPCTFKSINLKKSASGFYMNFILKSIIDEKSKLFFGLIVFLMLGYSSSRLPWHPSPVSLLLLLLFFESIVYSQILLFEKNIGISRELFLAVTPRSILKWVCRGVTARTITWCISFIISLLVFPNSLLSQLIIAPIGYFIIIIYDNFINNIIIVQRKKRPHFVEEYVALLLIILAMVYA
ncbi:hypothetical protein [Lactococcus termiticola]|uniref:Uncharacterized protein n=1 Tax=Lactococcus termiticola TaxID=2169526 RepID=A0A2R5HD16_9LACT|nr:hypothetical protein [Lactococcus termiticola]GBG95974.1 hypothetical protein NtB2_00076 [Lactococcus termiticola]